MDVIFYYLRKKGKYSAEPKVKFTTTDCLFDLFIKGLHSKFVTSKNKSDLINVIHPIADYIKGKRIWCPCPWYLCDHILFVIHMELESHWILARLNLEERRIYMYNSLNSGMKDAGAIKACQPHSVILPYFFALFDEFRRDGKPFPLDPFEVVKVEGLPQQTLR